MGAPKGNKNAEGNDGGRPTLYRPEYAKEAHKLCLLGSTDVELADFFEVSISTIKEWKKKHVEFSTAIKSGKTIADAEVASKLYHRATGYSMPAVKIFLYEGQPVVVPYTENFPPETAAMIFWLKNRQREKWRDRIDNTLAGPDDGPVQHDISGTVSQEAMDALRLKVEEALSGK